jgi:hypothetical protein
LQETDSVKPEQLFKTVWAGYAAGATALVLPLMLAIQVCFGLLTPGGIGPLESLVFLVLLPFVFIIQGFFVGCLVTLGWWVIGKVQSARR